MRTASLAHLSGTRRHLLAIALCALAAAVVYPVRNLLEPVNTAMLLLLVVAFVAAWLGRAQAIVASFVSVALFDFFFVPPQLSFAVSDVKYLVTFVVMLLVSLLVGQLTNSLQASADEARRRERRTHALYALARGLAGAMTVGQVVEQVTAFLRDEADSEVRFHIPDDDDRLQPVGPAAGAAETLAANGIYLSSGGPAGRCVAVAGVGLLLALDGATRCRGVLAVQPRGGADRLDTLRPMLEAVASLAAIALERLHFVAVAQASQLETEAERLRSSILSSISHDIRTPLTVLFGLADSLTLADGPLSDNEREAAQSIRDQAGRLHEMVDKLLDMARLQAGKVRLRKEWQALDEIIGAAIALLGDALRAHPVTVAQPPGLPLVAVDAVLIERVFCNLFENAAKYATPGTPIAVELACEGPMLVVTVRDRGRGFPPGSAARIFNLFERGQPESAISGVGLGLAICRAIVEAHGGWIAASNPADGGACVRFALPRNDPPAIAPEAAAGAGA